MNLKLIPTTFRRYTLKCAHTFMRIFASKNRTPTTCWFLCSTGEKSKWKIHAYFFSYSTPASYTICRDKVTKLFSTARRTIDNIFPPSYNCNFLESKVTLILISTRIDQAESLLHSTPQLFTLFFYPHPHTQTNTVDNCWEKFHHW